MSDSEYDLDKIINLEFDMDDEPSSNSESVAYCNVMYDI